jgi:hypothetical protein
MQFHLDEISLVVAKGAHAVLLLDRAGWHTTGNLITPKNITLGLARKRVAGSLDRWQAHSARNLAFAGAHIASRHGARLYPCYGCSCLRSAFSRALRCADDLRPLSLHPQRFFQRDDKEVAVAVLRPMGPVNRCCRSSKIV